MTNPVISVSELDYYYPDKKALQNINLTIHKGDITALVGPNGAGKTTLMRCLAGLDTPFNGKIEICGVDILENPREGHTKLGFLSDDFGLYHDLTVRESLEFAGGCHNISPAQAVPPVIERLGLESVADKKCRELSRGWRQRVGIGMSIIHHPELLILDEPASGLDPESRSDLSRVLKALRDEGMSILVSSHILSELEEYSTAMLVLRDGKIQEHITLEQHRSTTVLSQITIILAAPLSQEDESFINQASENKVGPLSQDRKMITVSVPNDPESKHRFLKQLIEKNIPVCSYVPTESSLQDLYLELSRQTKN